MDPPFVVVIGSMGPMNKTEILSSANKPTLQPIEIQNIPDALRLEPRWLLWNFAWRGGKWSKPPVGTSTDSTTWSTFEVIWERYKAGRADGIGFALGDGWAGVDLDDCRNDDGELTLVAQDIVETLDTYTEVSPTGTGVKLLCRANPPKGCKSEDGKVEIYGVGRYFTVTGQRLSGEIAERQVELETVHAKYVARPKQQSISSNGASCGCLEAMLTIKPKPTENDGTSRLFAWCCRAVEHNLSDEQAIATVRAAEKELPFPKLFSDSDICARIRNAEGKTTRGIARRSILVTNDFPKLVEETVEALTHVDVFQHLGALTQISYQPPKCKYAKDDNGAPRLKFIKPGGMLEVVAKAADFYQYDGRTKKAKQTLPSEKLTSAVYHRGNYPGVRPIHGVVCHPILLPTGEIVSAPGYHGDTGKFVSVSGDWPQLMSTEKAIATLRDVWVDFPFSSPGSEAACFAALATLLCRGTIYGNTPLFMVDGNKPRCGKGLLTDTWTAIAEGRRASRYSMSDQNELRKFLTSVAVAGGSYVLFDNVTARLEGATLEAALTTGAISDRVLGLSQQVDIPLPICWFATGNNCTLGRDMTGRTVPIRLDVEADRPEERTGFRHANLLDYIAEHRCELLIAGLSIVANYILAGSPKQAISNFGGFEEWSNLIRAAIVFAGLADPLGDRQQYVELAHDDANDKTAALAKLWSFSTPVTVKKAIEEIYSDQSHLTLRSVLDERPKDTTPAEYCGKLLRSGKGRWFTRSEHKTPKWTLKA